MDKSIIFDIWLSQVFMHKFSGYGQLISMFETAENIFINGQKEIDFSLYHPTVLEAFRLKDLTLAKDIYDSCIKNEVKVLTFSDVDYPENFKSIENPPIVLYCKGNVEELNKPSLTIVGERHPSDEGKLNAVYFSSECEKAGLRIVTGFADGIEHEILKSTKSPVTILPSGILKASPRANVKHLKRILDEGGTCISEYAPNYDVQSFNFRYRNRLLAALSDSTLVIEAGLKSGTSITVNYCSDYGKECYIIPGSIHSKHYEGNFKYLKNGAQLITHPAEILYDYYMKYPYLAEKETENNIQINYDLFDEYEQKILNILAEKPMSAEELVNMTDFSVNKINSCLINLEIMGAVKSTSPDLYAINK